MLTFRGKAAPPGIAHAALSHAGIRSLNEDAVYSDAERGLFLVVDGCGGAGHGDQASAMVVAALIAEHGSPENALREANQSIFEATQQVPDRKRMGATAALASIQGDWATLFHIGEARAYLIRDSKLMPLTEDHTLAAQLVKLRQLPPEIAVDHPARKTLTRYLGKDASQKPNRQELKLLPGDALLLCTDGFYTALEPENLISLAEGNADDLEARLQRAFQSALANGCQDNLSAVILCVPRVQPLPPVGPIGVSTQLRELLEAMLCSAVPRADLQAFCRELLSMVMTATSAMRAALVMRSHGAWTRLGTLSAGDEPMHEVGPDDEATWLEALDCQTVLSLPGTDRTIVVPVPAAGGTEGGLAFIVELPPGAELNSRAMAPYLELAAWYPTLARIVHMREVDRGANS